MHIVIDARSCSDHFPGIARYIVGLVEGLAALPERPQLALLYDPRATLSRFDLPAVAERAGARLEPLEASPFEARQQWRVPMALRRLGPDLYHATSYLRPYGPLPCPSISTIHDAIPRRFPAYFSPASRVVIELSTRLALLRSRRIIAVSESTRADLLRYYRVSPQKIAVIPEAAEDCFQPQSADQVVELRRRLALPERYLLYLGSNKPHKNLVCLVEAWALARAQPGAAGARLVIAGHWEQRYPEARLHTDRLGLGDAVRWLGPVAEEDLPALYSGAQAFVFPSLYEGFGLPPLEAMACGVPVITARSAALEEVCGSAALLVDPADPRELASAMVRLLGDDQARPELAGRALLRAATFSWRRTADLTLQEYKRTLQ